MAIKMIFRIVFLFVTFGICEMVNIPGFYSWSNGEREDLFCPDKCKSDEVPDQCCSCEGKPCWELNPTLCPTKELSVEYLDIFGKSEVVGSTNSSFVELRHTRGLLTEVPGNICNFAQQLVTLDLRYNKLSAVSLVQCLTELDTLRLDFNRIKYIENTTFTKMKDLRILTISNNLIQRLDPNVIIIEGGNIPIIDFSDNNNLEVLDISNVFRPGPFCTLNFTNSSVEHLTNELGFIMEKIMHGPGDILLEHTHLGSFINFTSIGINDMKEFGKYIDGQISIDSSSIDCDCTLFPFLESLGSDVGKYWTNFDGQTFECYSPEYMKGKNLTDMVKTGKFEGLTCDLSEKPDCPHYLCHCIDMPNQNKVLVNCTGAGFKSMPKEMPIGAWNNYKIDVILADNKITELPERNYYPRLVSLDLRQNDITAFTKNAARGISSILNIENQILETLPSDLQHKDPNLITFGPHPIVCNFSNIWIGDWIRLKNGQGRLKCLVDGKVIAAEDVTEHTLNCNQFTPLPSAAIVTSAVGGITIFVVVAGLCFLFRHEVTILKRTLFRKKLTEGVCMIDVFLSFYDDNEQIFRMVSQYIKPALLEAGYTVFIPWEDIPYGSQRDDELAIAVGRSVNYVIVLCDHYAEDYQTVSELEVIWNSFEADKAKQIILINYENLNSSAIKDERLRAVRRTRCLDFSKRDSKLISRLKHKLGKPMFQKKIKDEDSKTETDSVSESNSSEDEPDNLLDPEGVNVNGGDISVFDRLAIPRPSTCNCKFRKCYLHDETLVQRPRPSPQTNKVVPL